MAEFTAFGWIDGTVNLWARSRRAAPAVHGLPSGGQSVPGRG
jgi:hypothetical protein